MEALPWTVRVTVSLPTNVPALGLKRTARESDWAGGEDSRLDEQASRTRTSTAWRARRVHVLLALDIRAIQFPGGSLEHWSGNGAKIGRPARLERAPLANEPRAQRLSTWMYQEDGVPGTLSPGTDEAPRRVIVYSDACTRSEALGTIR